MIEKKILILEDELLQAIDLSEFLADEGYKTKTADTFQKALDLVYSFGPQLIICDINLKEKATGVDFAKEVKKYFPSIEVIFITAITKLDTIAAAQGTEPLNYIVKPWKEEQVKVSIQMAFNFIAGKQQKNNVIENLTMTEYKILKFITKQKSSKEIAQLLFISEKTVKNHRHNIIQKLGLPNEKNSLLKWAVNNADI